MTGTSISGKQNKEALQDFGRGLLYQREAFRMADLLPNLGGSCLNLGVLPAATPYSHTLC